MTKKELQAYLEENPNSELEECRRCNDELPEEFMRAGFCPTCYDDMCVSWNEVFKTE